MPDARPPATALKDCRYGRMLYLVGDVYIGRALELYGEYSDSEGEVFNQLLSHGQVVVEVGANIGAHTLHLAKLVGPTGLVMAFEPQRIVFSLLCANLVLNEQFHAVPIRGALGSEPGTIKVPTLDPWALQNFGGLELHGHTAGEDVPVGRLDDHRLPGLRLLKIDVEGMETDVLRGATKTIQTHRPIIYTENDRREKSAELIKLLFELGYEPYWHVAPMFNPNNFAGNKDNVFHNTVSINMLCLPKEQPFKITGFRLVAGPDDWWDVARSPAE